MNIRHPSNHIEDVRASVIDMITLISGQPRFELKTVEVMAVASTTISAELTSNTLTKLKGAVQIASTANEQPYVTYKNTKSVTVSWTFGASTSGKQTMTFLLIGV